jgi:5-methylcytosine-specific restriction enzyme subunit McrC
MAEHISPTVDPKAVPVRNAWYLLLYAWDLAHLKDRWDSASETSPDLLGLLARVLVDCTSDLLRRQLTRAHQVSVREIPGVRGRVDFASSIRRMSFYAGRAVCAFPELTIDTPRNRLILATLNRLITDDRLNIGASRERVQTLRHDLRALVHRMEGVTLQRVRSEDFGRVQLGRNDDAYRLPLAVCALIAKSAIPTEESGHHVMTALVRDEIAFRDVFERFVRNFLRQNTRGAKVRVEYLSWPDEANAQFVPTMKTDITIDWPDPNRRRLVIDTKYYAKSLSTREDRADKFHASHLYQLYAYLRTQEERGEAYRVASGALLYPTTDKTINETMRVQGHDMRVVTLDLTRPWRDIERRLVELTVQ